MNTLFTVLCQQQLTVLYYYYKSRCSQFCIIFQIMSSMIMCHRLCIGGVQILIVLLVLFAVYMDLQNQSACRTSPISYNGIKSFLNSSMSQVDLTTTSTPRHLHTPTQYGYRNLYTHHQKKKERNSTVLCALKKHHRLC